MPGWLSALRFVGIGGFVGGSIFFGVFLGRLIDRRFGTEPWITLAGLLAGLLVAVAGVYHLLKSFLREMQENDKKGQDQS